MQIMEKILLSPKKTGLHDDVLRILYLHLDPILPVPRVQMLSVCAEYFYLLFDLTFLLLLSLLLLFFKFYVF